MSDRCTETMTSRERLWTADRHGTEYSLEVPLTHECVSSHGVDDDHQCDFCGYRWSRKDTQ